MGSRVVFLVVAGLAVAGCGSTNKATPTAPASSAAAPTVLAYSVPLSGANGPPAGAPNGSGLAVLTANPHKGELCWQFSQLMNVTAPTLATLYGWGPGLSGRHGIHLGRTYRPSGCQHEPAILFRLLEAHPQSYAIGIYNAQFHEGAVRAPASTNARLIAKRVEAA